MATTGISLVREQSEQVGVPRALWVPFALGRPLGSARDPGFQKAVIRAALDLLRTATGPTIADYPIEAPPEEGATQWACPLNLAPAEANTSLGGRLESEVGRLKPWAAESRRRRGRTLFGASGAGPEQVELVARCLATMAEQGDVLSLPDGDADWAFEMPMLIRHLADDLRTYYHEAVAAQPGSQAPSHEALNDWIFGGTVLGECLQGLAAQLDGSDHPDAALVRRLRIPEGR